MRLVVRHHMPGSVDHVEGQPIVDSHPTFQTSPLVQNASLGLDHFPAHLSDIFLGLNVGNLGVDVAGVEQYLQACLFETLEQIDSADIFAIDVAHMRTAGLPLLLDNFELSLDLIVIEVLSKSFMVRTASRLVFWHVVQFLIEGTVPVSTAAFRSQVAYADGIVGVDAKC